jgi:hypothetical protein
MLNLRSGATRAIHIEGPLRAGVKAVHPASLALLEGIPGIDFADSTVTFAADSIGDAYRTIQRLVRVAGTNYSGILSGTVAASPGGAALMQLNRQNLVKAWFDYESGRWTPPAAPVASQRFHGPR